MLQILILFLVFTNILIGFPHLKKRCTSHLKKKSSSRKITQKDYRQHSVNLVFSAPHCVRWGRDIGKEKAWRQPDSELPLPSERGSWNRWLAKSTRKEQNFANRMFASLVKILKGKLQFLKKAINNLLLMEMATVPLIPVEYVCVDDVWMILPARWDVIVVLVWVLSF